MPFGDRGAYWALLGPDVDLRFTTYNTDGAAEIIRDTRSPLADMFVAAITNPPAAHVAAELFTR